MSTVRDQLLNMFGKVSAGTVTEAEGTMLINSLAKKEPQEVVKELYDLIHNTPAHLTAQLIFHTVAASRSRLFFDVLTSALDHKREDVSIFACEELSRYFAMEAKFVLAEHLNSDAYHVRKSSATIIAKVFGDSGLEILKKHVLAHAEHYYRMTSADVLANCGKKGVDALVAILNFGNHNAAATVAEVLSRDPYQIADADVPKILNALMEAGDANAKDAIVALLKLAASLGKRTKQFVEYVRAYEDWPDELVSAEAWNALMEIEKAR
ncbi:MAG: hypothetical protein HY894_06340 [Deltaproteobacteria bacterium]|nr:hypothetical protein [Deltaproteobacteria bacterium]